MTDPKAASLLFLMGEIGDAIALVYLYHYFLNI